MSVSLCVSVWVSLSLSLFGSLTLSASPGVPLSLSLSLFLSLSLYLSFSLSVYLHRGLCYQPFLFERTPAQAGAGKCTHLQTFLWVQMPTRIIEQASQWCALQQSQKAVSSRQRTHESWQSVLFRC